MDTVFHLEVDEEQWEITQGSKRQAKWVWSPRAMSGLRSPDPPHAQQTAINVSVQCNGELLPDIVLLTQCYYYRGIRLNAMKRFRLCSL